MLLTGYCKSLINWKFLNRHSYLLPSALHVAALASLWGRTVLRVCFWLTLSGVQCLVYLDKDPNIICTQVSKSVVELVVDGVWPPVRSAPIMLLQYEQGNKHWNQSLFSYFPLSSNWPNILRSSGESGIAQSDVP